MKKFLRMSVSLWLVAAFLCSFDLHLQVLQIAAWTRMVVAYSQVDGLEQGVRETFDGEHPCKLCCAIRKARSTKSTESIAAAPLASRLDSVAPDVAVALPVRTEKSLALTIPDFSGRQLAETPPVPPPRA